MDKFDLLDVFVVGVEDLVDLVDLVDVVLFELDRFVRAFLKCSVSSREVVLGYTFGSTYWTLREDWRKERTTNKIRMTENERIIVMDPCIFLFVGRKN